MNSGILFFMFDVVWTLKGSSVIFVDSLVCIELKYI